MPSFEDCAGFMVATPEQIEAVMAKESPIANNDLYVAIVKQSMPMFSPDGRLNRAGIENAYKVLSSFDPAVARAEIDLDATYTDRFVINALH